MDVTVSCRHVELTSAQRELVTRKIARLARIVAGMDRAEVHFTEERNRRIANREVCEVVMEGRGNRVLATASAAEPLAAVDAAVEKLEHQLHALKSRLTARHHGRAHKPAPA